MNRRFIVAITGSLLAGVGVSLISVTGGSPQFDEAFLAGLAATVAGAAFAIATALGLLALQRSKEIADVRSRKRELLEALRDELRENVADLADRYVRPSNVQVGDKRSVKLPSLSVEVWAAVSASGDLSVVQDANLLGKIARAYRFIGQTRFLEDVANRTMTSDGRIPPHIGDGLIKTDPITKAAMDEALAVIEAELQSLKAVDAGMARAQ